MWLSHPLKAADTHVFLIRKTPILQLGEHQLSIDLNLKGPWYEINARMSQERTEVQGGPRHSRECKAGLFMVSAYTTCDPVFRSLSHFSPRTPHHAIKGSFVPNPPQAFSLCARHCWGVIYSSQCPL